MSASSWLQMCDIENSADLVTLDNKVCINEPAATSINIIEPTGQEHYDYFRKHVL